MGNKLFALLTILVMAVSLIVGCQTVSKKTEPTTLEINPRIAEDYYNRGDAYRSKGQFDLSIADYNNALEINPRYAMAYYNRGIAYYFKKEYDKSLENVKKAQELGDKIDPKFLEDLSKASGRKR
jgi:tetratricopeptide (TPR) repeat protein